MLLKLVHTDYTVMSCAFDSMFTVGGTQTFAVRQSDGSYKLYGYKWFSSATDADMALTLACDCDVNEHYTEVHHAVYSKTLNVCVPRQLSKTAKLKGVNIDTIPSLNGISRVLELCDLT